MIVNKKITIDLIAKQNLEHMVSDMDGEKVLLSIKKGKYYNLGMMGSIIWTLIEKPMIIADIIESLTADYDISLEDCRNQVIGYIEELLKEDLIQIQDLNNY